MSAIATVAGPSPASVWEAMTGEAFGEVLLEWPPDLFAFTEVVLERSEAYRFALSPPGGATWPPERFPWWPEAVADAGRLWSALIDAGEGELPDLLAQEWGVFAEAADEQLERLTDAGDWRICEALLTLHAIADEACAGLGVALDAADGTGALYRARARELLARTGSLARISSRSLRVLPKLRTPPNGTSLRSLSRYACALGPGVDTRWHKLPGHRAGLEPDNRGANYLLLPWPLRVRESDFHALPGSVRLQGQEPYGFFEFEPSERLDLDLVDRTLLAARDEVRDVNIVVLPESAIDHGEITALEALLAHHGVTGLIAGVRQRPEQPGQFPRNWVHIGVSSGDRWIHIRQDKHHRWSLDEGQIHQYHLGGALHPHIRWWEAMQVPRRSIQFIESGEGATLVSLVCEDLAQIDDVADVLRAVGPTLVVTPLLDGPQLSSRWAARYASVLADDPGSAVLTLTSYGMARRSRPHGQQASTIIALWKDTGRGTREIPLETGAHGVLISVSGDHATRRSSDGRLPVANGSEFFNMSVYQVHATKTGSHPPRSNPPTRHVLDVGELTILTSWAEAVAEVLAATPEHLDALLNDADEHAPWRDAFAIAEPSEHLNRAIQKLSRTVRAAAADGDRSPEALLRALRDHEPDATGLPRLVRHVLRSAAEQRQLRQTRSDGNVRTRG